MGINVLVTGGAGFVGSHLVDALVQRGDSVRIIDSLVKQVHGGTPPPHLNPEAEFIEADLCDRDAVIRALAGIDVVFHQAAEVGIAQSMYEVVRYVKANTLGTAVLLQEMIERRDQFKKLVVASTMSAYGEGAYFCGGCDSISHPDFRRPDDLVLHKWEFRCNNCGQALEAVGTKEDKSLNPTSIYAISKQDQEQYCLTVGRAYKIPTVALRYFNVYGTRQALSNPYTGIWAIFSARLMNDKAPVIYEDGEQSRDFVHVSDIVRANLLAVGSDDANYEAVNIGTGKATTVNAVAQLLAKGLGKSILPNLPGSYREGDVRHCIADITKARKLLGYEPLVSLEDGASELLDWLDRQTARDGFETAAAELSGRSLVK